MSYQILITDQQGALAQAIAQGLDQSSFLKLITPVDSNFDWLCADQVEQLLVSQKPDLIINTLGWSDDGSATSEQALIAPLNTLVPLCQSLSVPFLQLSSYRVFDGVKSGFTEVDAPQPRDSVGELFLAAEARVATLEQHLILRLSWVIGALGQNLLTKLLLPIIAGQSGEVIAERRGAPVGHLDVARVVNALAKQIASGSQNWGVFHYGAGDVCTEEEFVTELISRLQAKGYDVGGSIDTGGGGSAPLSAALGYRRLMDNFGVQPRTWRQGLMAELSRWYSDHPPPSS